MTAPHNTKGLSQNPGLLQCDIGELHMDESQVVTDLLFPSDQQTPCAVRPGMTAFNHPATSALSDATKNTNPGNPKVISFYRPNGNHSTNYVDNAVALEYTILNAKGVNTDLHPITINTSFEYQHLAAGATSAAVDGWTAFGPGPVTVTHFFDADYAAKFDDPVPDGHQVAAAKNATLYQFVGTTVHEGTYHMSVRVGSPKGNVAGEAFQAGFMVADNNIALASDLAWGDSGSFVSGLGLTAGKWSTIDLDWIVDATSPVLGKNLYLGLSSTSDNTVCFDSISMVFVAVPEPSECVLLGGGALTLFFLWIIRRRHLLRARAKENRVQRC
jgi:hypothetical protein